MLHRESNEIPTRKCTRLGYIISPKLFTATLEDFFRNFDWGNRGIAIDGNELSNLRFADDLEELELSLNELSVASMQHSHKIIWQKQKYSAIGMSLKGQ